MNGTTQVFPIICAATKGNIDMVRLLLKNKTLNLNVVNEQGVNAFWVACMYGHG